MSIYSADSGFVTVDVWQHCLLNQAELILIVVCVTVMPRVCLECNGKQKYAEVGIPEFYKFLPSDKFPKLCAFALRILAMFGSTYVCEQFFSTMKVNKSAIRLRLTDEHLQSVLRLATIKDESLKPDIDSLVNSKRIQKSSI